MPFSLSLFLSSPRPASSRIRASRRQLRSTMLRSITASLAFKRTESNKRKRKKKSNKKKRRFNLCHTRATDAFAKRPLPFRKVFQGTPCSIVSSSSSIVFVFLSRSHFHLIPPLTTTTSIPLVGIGIEREKVRERAPPTPRDEKRKETMFSSSLGPSRVSL